MFNQPCLFTLFTPYLISGIARVLIKSLQPHQLFVDTIEDPYTNTLMMSVSVVILPDRRLNQSSSSVFNQFNTGNSRCPNRIKTPAYHVASIQMCIVTDKSDCIVYMNIFSTLCKSGFKVHLITAEAEFESLTQAGVFGVLFAVFA